MARKRRHKRPWRLCNNGSIRHFRFIAAIFVLDASFPPLSFLQTGTSYFLKTTNLVYTESLTPNQQTYGNRKDNEKGDEETAKENSNGKTRRKESKESDEIKKPASAKTTLLPVKYVIIVRSRVNRLNNYFRFLNFHVAISPGSAYEIIKIYQIRCQFPAPRI